ncbi:4'-phosphopantetheinyl transferase superfamily protein [Pseudoxanthomonas sp.]|uniref:4'-phosphopantetheinyl transferase family protein n=1 Tax=Pseudoxanthomonas sp. TaxID=1871049 RepID=UPI00260FDB6B|nr:4'-phosphopantetheinyl transferase superfamily protein [Pseudoxanthomonas sp.]WDS35366.1 MAG: 4'-phosphopantetheinyl transferase superfamily protein [Pseudoxanthomonas sp.]
MDERLHMAESPESFFSEQRIGPLQVWWTDHPPRSSGEPTARPLLESWFHLAPGALPLRRDARGKPRLEGTLAPHDVSWSHSGDALLLATGPGVEVGADIERLRPRPRALELAARFFTRAETASLHALAEADRNLAFLRLWCAKEAVLKAHGHGISFGLQRLEFAPIRADAPLQLVACDPQLGAPDDWTLHQWQPHPHYLAAVAWRARPAG